MAFLLAAPLLFMTGGYVMNEMDQTFDDIMKFDIKQYITTTSSNLCNSAKRAALHTRTQMIMTHLKHLSTELRRKTKELSQDEFTSYFANYREKKHALETKLHEVKQQLKELHELS